MNISRLFTAAMLLAMLTLASCTGKKFHVSGTITGAKDSTLFFENMSLNGPVTVDSVKLSQDGTFAFDGKAPQAPEFYRLRIGRQIVNIAVDSTENISVKASYPTMSAQYQVTGSEECDKMKELAIMQLNLQATVNAIQQNPNLSYDQVDAAIQQALENYKAQVKAQYIFKAPMKAYAYFALFQTVAIGNQTALIFDPRSKKQDVQVFAAVATSWDTFYRKSERGLNLHNIALEGMKNMRIIQAERSQTLDASKVTTTGVLEIALPDREGNLRRLTALKGKVVLLDFHVFASKGSTERIMKMRDLYNKYHAQGLEIYQVSLDSDEHFWKESVAALPWICVHDNNGLDSQYASQYNVQTIPTFFLIDRDNVLQKRDSQIKNLDTEIKTLLK